MAGVFRLPFFRPPPTQAGLGTLTTPPVTYSMTADAASFAATGQDAQFIASIGLVADTASYSLSGQAALFSYSFTASVGSFTLSGQAVGLQSSLAASSASFALSGQDAALFQSVNLTASAASFTLSGQAALFSYSFTASAATFTLSGQAANQAWAAGAASFALSGQAATFSGNWTLSAAAFTLSGQAANQAWAAAQASFILSGQDALLWTAIGLVASGASYTYVARNTLPQFSLNVSPTEGAVAEFAVGEFGASAITLNAARATFTLSGQASIGQQSFPANTASYSLSLVAAGLAGPSAPAAFTFTGQAVSFAGSFTLSHGAYTLTLYSAGLIAPVDSAAFNLTGVSTVYNLARTADAATFTLTPQIVHFTDLETASFTFTGNSVALSPQLLSSAAAFTLTGQDVVFINAKVMAADVGSFTVTAQDAGFGRGMGAELATFNLTGVSLALRTSLAANNGAFTWSGNGANFNLAFGLATGQFQVRGWTVIDVQGPSGDLFFLVEVDAHDGDEVTTQFLCETGFLTQATDVHANQFYLPRLMDPGNFTQEIPLPGESGTSASAGDVVVANGDPGDGSNLDDWFGYGFGGRPILIKSLPAGSTSLASATTLYRGRVGKLSSTNPLERFEIAISNKLSDLQKPLLTVRFAGTTTSTGDSAEGNADLKDQIKQQIWGEASNVLLQPANPYDLIYLVSNVTDYSQLVSITVYDGGLALTLDGDSADIAALRAASISPGHYRTCLAEGLIRLGGTATKAVTADVVEGTAPADRTAAQIVLRMLMQFGVPSEEISAGSFDDLDNKNSAVCYAVVNDDRDALDEMQTILNSIGGRLLPNRNDLFEVTRFEAPSSSPTLIFDIEDDAIATTIQRLEGTPPAYQVELGWGKVHHRQLEGDVAGAVTAERRAYLGKEIRLALVDDTDVLEKHLDARIISYETRLAYEADAQDEAERILDLMKVERAEYSVTVPLSEGWAAQVGGSITLRHPRLGLSSGKDFAVLKRTDEYVKNTVGLERVWG